MGCTELRVNWPVRTPMLQKPEDYSIRTLMKLEADDGNILARMPRVLQRVYYRYSLEVGISVLEW